MHYPHSYSGFDRVKVIVSVAECRPVFIIWKWMFLRTYYVHSLQGHLWNKKCIFYCTGNYYYTAWIVEETATCQQQVLRTDKLKYSLLLTLLTSKQVVVKELRLMVIVNCQTKTKCRHWSLEKFYVYVFWWVIKILVLHIFIFQLLPELYITLPSLRQSWTLISYRDQIARIFRIYDISMTVPKYKVPLSWEKI